MPSEQGSLKQRTVSGVAWTVIAQGGRRAVDLVALIILARLLSPEDFGLLGMVVVFSGFVAVFNELGFGAALVQKKKIDDRHLSSVFWLNVAIGVLLAALFAASAPLVALFYSEPRLTPITALLALGFLIEAPAIVPLAILNRTMRFKRQAAIEGVAVLASATVAVALALTGFGVLSLAVRILVHSTLRAAILWLQSEWRPKLVFDRTSISDLLGFSGHLVGYQVFNYWIRNADYLLIGRFVGSAALGVYTWAYKIMMLPTSLTLVIDRVMFPALSSIQDEKARVKAIYLRANALIGLVTMPMACGLFVTARPFVLTFLGAQWEAVVPVLQVLCFVTLKQPTGATTGWIYQSQGRTDLQFRWSLLAGVVAIASFAIGVRWGALGVATAYAINRYLLWYPAIEIPGRLVGLTFREFVTNIAGVLGCSILMGAAVWAVGLALPSTWPAAAILTIQVATGAAVYGGLLYVLRIAAARDGLVLLREQLRGRSEVAPRPVETVVH